MPRGAKSAKTCTLDMLKQDGSVPQVSFFKIKHMKGFWPFTVNTEEEEIELAVGISPNPPLAISRGCADNTIDSTSARFH